jgi:transcriptional regulator with XRE-family HTH domain
MFDQLIKDLLAAGLSEYQIAAQVGCSQPTINRIKRGTQSNIGARIADGLRALHAARVSKVAA